MDKKFRINRKLLGKLEGNQEDTEKIIDKLLVTNGDNSKLRFYLGMYRKAKSFRNDDLAKSSMHEIRKILRV